MDPLDARLPRPGQRRLNGGRATCCSIIAAFVGFRGHVRRATEMPAQAYPSHAIVVGKKGGAPMGSPESICTHAIASCTASAI
eukprot:9096610-Pyramimonas_sp.AAC.1